RYELVTGAQACAPPICLSDPLLPRPRAYHEVWLDGAPVAGGPPDAEPDPIYGSRYLPRKFKVAFAFPDDNCCDVHSNDLGFLAVDRKSVVQGRRSRLRG